MSIEDEVKELFDEAQDKNGYNPSKRCETCGDVYINCKCKTRRE